MGFFTDLDKLAEPTPAQLAARAELEQIVHASNLAAMTAAGAPPEQIYAERKTLLWLTPETAANCPAWLREEWQSAIDEYHALEADRAGRAPD